MILSYIATLLFVISALPQTLRLIQTKDSRAISISMYAITTLAMGINLYLAISESNNNLILSTSGAFITLVINLFLIIKYR